jgi:hypothetical protein
MSTNPSWSRWLLWINVLITLAQRQRSGVFIRMSTEKDRRGCVEELNKALLCSTRRLKTKADPAQAFVKPK